MKEKNEKKNIIQTKACAKKKNAHGRFKSCKTKFQFSPTHVGAVNYHECFASKTQRGFQGLDAACNTLKSTFVHLYRQLQTQQLLRILIRPEPQRSLDPYPWAELCLVLSGAELPACVGCMSVTSLSGRVMRPCDRSFPVPAGRIPAYIISMKENFRPKNIIQSKSAAFTHRMFHFGDYGLIGFRHHYPPQKVFYEKTTESSANYCQKLHFSPTQVGAIN